MLNATPDDFTVRVIPIGGVSRLTRIPERTVRRDLMRALEKLSKDGKLEQLFALAQYMQREDYGPTLRCASIECRPEKWK